MMIRPFAACCILLALLLVPLSAAAQTPTLNPWAQSVLDQGLAAAQKQDWKGAIQHFLEVQQAYPRSPEIWFDLGLAELKLPGYEICALAWFKGYLILAPDAPNAAAVKEQINALEVSYKSRFKKILDAFDTTARSNLGHNGIDERAIADLATAHIYIGDLAGATKLLNGNYVVDGQHWDFEKDDYDAGGPKRDLAQALFMTGQYEASEKYGGDKSWDDRIEKYLETNRPDDAWQSFYLHANEADIELYWRGLMCWAFQHHDLKLIDELADSGERNPNTNERIELVGFLVDLGQRDRAIKLADKLPAAGSADDINGYGRKWANKLLSDTDNSSPKNLCRNASFTSDGRVNDLFYYGKDGIGQYPSGYAGTATHHNKKQPANWDPIHDETELAEFFQHALSPNDPKTLVLDLDYVVYVLEATTQLYYKVAHGPFSQ